VLSPVRPRNLLAAVASALSACLFFWLLPPAAAVAAALAVALGISWLCSLREAPPSVDSVLISNLSHEMRTPLNGILGLTQVLLDKNAGPEERELLEMIKASGESLLRVLNDLLDYSAIQAGKVHLQSNPFRLRRWVRQSVALHAPHAHRKGLSIAYWVAPDVPELVIGDSERLRQVLWNLIANAIKFTEEGEILVEVRARPGTSANRFHFLFSVADTGVGVPEANRTGIFEPFAQGENARPEQGGLGLGLAISSEIAGRMGGSISVESEGGKGTRFELGVELEVGAEEPSPARRFPGIRALLVDESPWEREVISKELAALGVEVEATASTIDARIAVEGALESGKPFSVLLLDARRLEDALSLANDSRKLARVSVVLLLLTHQRVPPELLRSHEIAGTLTKPVAPIHLVRAFEILSRGDRVEKPEDVQTQGMDRPELGGVKVLLAEDHPINRTVVIRLLENLGASVTTASNGMEALEHWAKERFDILLLDLEMPELDGLGVVGEIRARERGTNGRFPVVALTAHAREEERDRCFRAGMDGFVTKPIAEAELVNAMRNALKSRRGEASTEGTKGTNGLPVLDKEAAIGRASGDRALLAELARIFLEETPETLSRIERAFEKGDARAIERLAHRMKGALLTLAAPAAARAALDLETRAGLPDGVPREALDRLRRELSRLEEQLKGLTLETRI
jgi:signal transduction histidine kinase/CheY-like chemotaxis protein/HPt (histidine-containing phosphotransfer) domain-containing protein